MIIIYKIIIGDSRKMKEISDKSVNHHRINGKLPHYLHLKYKTFINVHLLKNDGHK